MSELSQTRKRIKGITPERVSERIRKQVVDVQVPKIPESRRVQRIQSRQSDGRRGDRVLTHSSQNFSLDDV